MQVVGNAVMLCSRSGLRVLYMKCDMNVAWNTERAMKALSSCVTLEQNHHWCRRWDCGICHFLAVVAGNWRYFVRAQRHSPALSGAYQ